MLVLHSPEAPGLDALQGYQEYQKQRSKQEPLFKKMQKAFKSKDEEAEQEKLEQYKKTLQPTKLRTVRWQPVTASALHAPTRTPCWHLGLCFKAAGSHLPKKGSFAQVGEIRKGVPHVGRATASTTGSTPPSRQGKPKAGKAAKVRASCALQCNGSQQQGQGWGPVWPGARLVLRAELVGSLKHGTDGQRVSAGQQGGASHGVQGLLAHGVPVHRPFACWRRWGSDQAAQPVQQHLLPSC